LISKKQNSLEREFTTAKVEEVLKGWTKQINHHCILTLVMPFKTVHNHILCQTNEQMEFLLHQQGPELVTQLNEKYFVNSSLIFQLWMFGFGGFKFDGDFFTRDDVGT
jgi:hypothetical protein